MTAEQIPDHVAMCCGDLATELTCEHCGQWVRDNLPAPLPE